MSFSMDAVHRYDGPREMASANYEGTVFACLCGARYEDMGELEQHIADSQETE